MKEEEIEKILEEKCTALGLREVAFNVLQEFFDDKIDNEHEDLWCGFDKSEIKPVFEGFQYRIQRRYGNAIIRARIGLYINNDAWLDSLQPIGYYELESDLQGEILDDYFVIEQEKHLSEINIVSHIQSINQKTPIEYFVRNHVQYEFVAYISLIGTRFISKDFNGAGMFISRAYDYLTTTDNNLLDKDFLKESKSFLRMLSCYLIENKLISESVKRLINETKENGC